MTSKPHPSFIRYDAWKDLRLIPAAAAAWAAAAWVSNPPVGPGTVAALGLVTALLGLVLLLWAARRRLVLLPVVSLALVCLATVLVTAAVRQATTSGRLAEQAEARRLVSAVAVVVGDPYPLGDSGRRGYRLRLRVLETSDGRTESREPAPGVLVTTIDASLRDTAVAGSTVELRGRLAPPDPRDRATARMSMTRRGIEVVSKPNRLHRSANRVRAGLREAAGRQGDEVAGLLPSLVVGDTENLSEALREDMRRSGLAHLSAVSGANTTIVCGAVLLFLRWGRCSRRVQVGCAALALAAFVVVARPEPSVVRAGVMGVVALLGLLVGRRGGAVSALSTAVVVLTVIQPGLSREVGFALSVAATAGLALLTPGLTRSLERFLPRWLAVALAVPLAAQVACGPILVMLRPQVAWLAVVANLVVAPAVVPATILGALVALLAWWWPLAGTVLAWAAAWPVRWIAAVATWVSSSPLAVSEWPEGGIGVVLMGLAGGGLVCALFLLPRILPEPRARGGMRCPGGRAARVAGVVVALVLATLAVTHLRRPVTVDWRVAACDVGQGEAVVVRTGTSSGVVVDAGPDPRAADSCLDRLGIRTVDLLVLSHFHADHVDGVPGVARGRTIRAAWLDPFREPASAYRTVLSQLAGVPLIDAQRGLEAQLADVHVEVVQAGIGERTTGTGETSDEESDAVNGSSVVLVVRAPGLTMVTSGDLVPDAQRRARAALAGLGVGPVDVVTVSHHGSRHQDRGFYRHLRAKLALVSVGEDNDYGHPAPATLAMLEQLGAVIRRTDVDSLVLVGATATEAGWSLWVTST